MAHEDSDCTVVNYPFSYSNCAETNLGVGVTIFLLSITHLDLVCDVMCMCVTWGQPVSMSCYPRSEFTEQLSIR